jgi:GT2 family glycosyltransferase
MDVSIIIVNFNNNKLLKNCLYSIFSLTNSISFEVIVSDNGSTDGSLEMIMDCFPQVIIIRNGTNIGFGAANNRALDKAKGKYIFYLNSDTVLKNNAVKLFFDYYESHQHEKLGALGCILSNSHNEAIHSYGTFASYSLSIRQLVELVCTNIILSLMHVLGVSQRVLHSFKKNKLSNSRLHFEGEQDVDFITGADLFLKNDPYARFDERYFLYFEDSSLQYVMMKRHLIRRIISGPQIYHLCGGSAGEDMSILRKVSFSRIQFEFSRIRWIMDRYGQNSIFVFVAKFFVLCAWIHPIVLNKTALSIINMIRFQNASQRNWS